MNRDGERRIYVQLTPDEPGLDALQRVQYDLPRQLTGRRVPRAELHMTMLHFGKTAEILESIREVVPLNDEAYEARLHEYLEATQSYLTDEAYHLQARGFDRFGHHQQVLVARYETPPELGEIYSHTYDELIRFLGACGITHATKFAIENANLGFAHTFKPHVTLYKSYNGPLPDEPPPDLMMRFMDLEY